MLRISITLFVVASFFCSQGCKKNQNAIANINPDAQLSVEHMECQESSDDGWWDCVKVGCKPNDNSVTCGIWKVQKK